MSIFGNQVGATERCQETFGQLRFAISRDLALRPRGIDRNQLAACRIEFDYSSRRKNSIRVERRKVGFLRGYLSRR